MEQRSIDIKNNTLFMLGLTKASKKHTSCRTRTNMSNSGEALKKKNKENMQ